jgi:hypothetical protein
VVVARLSRQIRQFLAAPAEEEVTLPQLMLVMRVMRMLPVRRRFRMRHQPLAGTAVLEDVPVVVAVMQVLLLILPLNPHKNTNVLVVAVVVRVVLGQVVILATLVQMVIPGQLAILGQLALVLVWEVLVDRVNQAMLVQMVILVQMVMLVQVVILVKLEH